MIRVLLVSGERGAGKTTVLREAARLAEAAGVRVAGLVTEHERDAAGMPLESRLVYLGTGESRLLARRGAALGGPAWPPPGRGPGDLSPFSFSEEAFAWGGRILAAALAAAGRTGGGASLLVLDEVGPVELELGRGFAPFLALLESASGAPAPGSPLVAVAVRTALVDRLAARLGASGGRPDRLAIGDTNRGGAPRKILGLL